MNGSEKRRRGEDRRRLELGPPKGWQERRRTVERRLPEVREIPFSSWLVQLKGYLAKTPLEV